MTNEEKIRMMELQATIRSLKAENARLQRDFEVTDEAFLRECALHQKTRELNKRFYNKIQALISLKV